MSISNVDGLVDRLAADIILRHVSGRRVLDVGHGAPQVATWVRDRAESLQVLPSETFDHSQATPRLPADDASCEVAYCLRTLPHLGHDRPSRDRAVRCILRELARVVIPGGIGFVMVDNAKGLSAIMDRVRGKKHDREEPEYRDTLAGVLHMTPATLQVSSLHGLRIVTVFPSMLDMPVLRACLTRIEWLGRDRSWLRSLGTHLLVGLRRTDTHTATVLDPDPDAIEAV